MDAEIKAKWVKALRSGKYKQGRSALRSATDEFCCLGVLCNVVAPNEWNEAALNGIAFTHGKHRAGSVPMPEYTSPIGIEHDQVSKLWKLNDFDGRNFREIADYIEQNL